MNHTIAVNGASGRIGRSVTFELSTLQDPAVRIGLLNDPAGIDRIIASLTGSDPVHGRFPWRVERLTDSAIALNGEKVRVYAEKDLTRIPFADLGITMVEECSGFFGDDKKDPTKRLADAFFQYGVQKVIQSYPANADATLVMGANHLTYDPAKHHLISNGSCTTKAMVGPLRALVDAGLTIHALDMTTVHAATNSQSPLETLGQVSTHKTGAAQAVSLVVPELAGLMDGMSFRVPVADGSIANMHFVASYAREPLTADVVNEILTRAANDSRYAGRIGIITDKEFSTGQHVVGRTENSLVGTSKTRVKPLPSRYLDSPMYQVQLICGYDNERGPPKDQVLLTQYVASR